MTLLKKRNPGCQVLKAPPGTPPNFTIPEGPEGKNGYVVGRGPHADLVLEDDYISSRHIVFWGGPEAVYASDLKSTNSSRLNDEVMQADKPYLIKEGDVISLAADQVILRFSTSITLGHPGIVPPIGRVENNCWNGDKIFVDGMACEVYVDGNLVEPRVVAKEFLIIDRLFQKKGTLVPMGELKQAGWPERVAVGDEEVHQLIKRLRRHIGDDPKHGQIQNIRAMGYKLT